MEPDDTQPDAGGDLSAVEVTRALLDDARRLGISAATRLAEEFGRLVPGTSFDPTGTGQELDDVAGALRAAQVAAERSVDTALDAVRDAMDAYANLAQHVLDLSTGAPRGGMETVRLTVAAGQTVRQDVWIHNTTPEPTAPTRVSVGELLDHDGRILDTKVAVEPTELPPVDPGHSAKVALVVDPPDDSTAGLYHGLIMVPGVPDAVLALSVRVLATGEAGDER